jgi:hypothetical protein
MGMNLLLEQNEARDLKDTYSHRAVLQLFFVDSAKNYSQRSKASD